MIQIPYCFHNAPVPGGGFVTGFAFHPRVPGILYARTDISGVYRYDFDRHVWHSLADGISHLARWKTFPLSIALDPRDKDALYVVAGEGDVHALCVSKDQGASFVHYPLPAQAHGNAPGRGTGERLLVSAHVSQRLYFASQSDGLFRSDDAGHSWRHLPVQEEGLQEEKNCTFIWEHPQNARVLIVGTTGAGNLSGRARGDSVYISRDGGAHFTRLPTQPSPPTAAQCTHPGYVAQRAAFNAVDGLLYITYNAPSSCWAGYDSCSCDTGASYDGRLLCYALDSMGNIQPPRDLTPRFPDQAADAPLGGGLAGIALFPDHPSELIVSTVCVKSGDGDAIFYSSDGGAHFRILLRGLRIGRMDFTVPYMRPECNGGTNLIHWLSDLSINPFDAQMALFNTGTGIFMTRNLLDARRAHADYPVVWKSECAGLEQTVHLNAYSPPTGRIALLDIIGDLGAFAFEDTSLPCDNSACDAYGNRYITCMNADFIDTAPAPVVLTARGNWTGKTKGGLVVSMDDCRIWQRLPLPRGLTQEIDALCDKIEQPNTNAGWAALSADGSTIVYSLACGCTLPSSCVVYTRDMGKTYTRSRVPEEIKTLKVFSDRVNPNVFDGFSEGGKLCMSLDGGETFVALRAPEGFPAVDLAGIDGMERYEIRVQSGKEGIVYLSLQEHGLWRLCFHAQGVEGVSISAPGESVYRVGLGKAAPGSDTPALYVNAVFSGVYGFYRSEDGGTSWKRLGDDSQRFGDIRSISGDPRRFGRIYIATGTRGVLCGDPI